ncbi:MAG TPA: glycosyltransferase [Candidatus Eremiobacteraceae bacterium]|nr:glycosyltransferase [Candidatus Eremiobacteraceae bacterium]
MKALIILRPDASSHYGGDTRLAYEIHSALRRIGVTADLVETESPEPVGYDVAHIVNVGEPLVCRRQFDACERAGVPVALSPVWLDVRELFGRGRAFEKLFVHEKYADRALRSAQALARADNNRLLGRERERIERREEQQRELLRRARVLMPNSAMEAKDCMVRLGVRDVPMVVVPIAASLEPEAHWREPKRGIAIVGRVETRKNQITAIFALRDEGVPIDVVGLCGDKGLVAACERWCRTARFHGKLPREQLLDILGGCAVHVMASWSETAGIANLEAAAAGAHLVVGDRGAEYEYFGEDADYADPADPESIRAAVTRALARPPRTRGDSLDRRLRRQTWDHAAQETARAYRIAIGG